LTALRLFEQRLVDGLAAYHTVDFRRRVAAISGSEVTSDLGATWAGLYVDVAAPVLSEQAVRRAFSFAVDARRIAVGLIRGEGTYLGAPPGASRPPGKLYRHSLRLARATLQDAGWRGAGVRSRGGQALSFTLAGLDDLLSFLVMRAVQLQAERAGIRLELVSLQSPRLWGGWLRSPRMRAALIISRDPPSGALRARFGLSQPANVSRVSDPTLQGSLALQDAGDSPGGAAAQRRLASLAAVLPLYRVRVTIASRGVVGVRASAAADGPFWNAEQWSLR
jgi:hypothetical protein